MDKTEEELAALREEVSNKISEFEEKYAKEEAD